MKNEYRAARIWVSSLRNLERVAADTGETIVAIIDRLAAAEAYRCDTVDLLTTNPFKDGEVVDLMRLLTEKNRDQAIRVLRALVQAG